MMFNSFAFICYFIAILVPYYLVRPKFRRIWLLVVSVLFYSFWNPLYVFLLLYCIIVTYGSGLLIGKFQGSLNRQKLFLALGIVLDLIVLFVFKYQNMMIELVNSVLTHVKFSIDYRFELMLPIGISFYTFQTIGYMIDVYRGKIKASKNIIEYALFVSFFPQLVAGPIERSENLIGQIKDLENVEVRNIPRIKQGLYMMLWGFFMKVVIADRAAIIADTVFKNYKILGSVELLIGIICFSIQIYCDFGGYSAIAIGAAKIMGIDLMENFNTPYFAGSIKDFWNRWHISLSSWFRDYLYIPLGGNRKGKLKKYRNLMIIFLVSGLWHGAEWSFVVWGGLHGLYMILEDMTSSVRERLIKKININESCFSWRLLQAIVVFVLTTFAWIFFRAGNISEAIDYIYRLFSAADPWIIFDGGIYSFGIPALEYSLLFVSVIILLVVDYLYLKTGKKLDALLQTQNLWFRWAVVILLLCGCIFFNCSANEVSTNQFIYFQF